MASHVTKGGQEGHVAKPPVQVRAFTDVWLRPRCPHEDSRCHAPVYHIIL